MGLQHTFHFDIPPVRKHFDYGILKKGWALVHTRLNRPLRGNAAHETK